MSVKTESEVLGFDINPEVADYIAKARIPYQEKDCEAYLAKAHVTVVADYRELVQRSDLLFFAVQTPHERMYEGITPTPTSTQDFNYSYLKAAISGVAEALRDNPDKRITLVVISTVLPGTMRDEIFPILSDLWDRVKFCYNPYFIAMGTTIPDYLDPEFVLLGERQPGDGQELIDLYSRVHSAPVRRMQIESAELTKVAYNTFIGFKIVFANTIAEIVDARGGNADEVTSALAAADKRLISGKYLSAGMADGGGCHPRDQIAMSWLAKDAKLSSNVFDYLARARDSQTQRQAEIVASEFHARKLPVVLMGAAYKADVNLTIGSPSVLLSHYLEDLGIPHSVFDPHVYPEVKFPTAPSIFFVATNHSSFLNMGFPVGSCVIDPWGNAVSVYEGVDYRMPGRGK